MKRIIEGQTYNTMTATKIAIDKWRMDGSVKGDESGHKVVETLYQTRGGAFFAHRVEYTGEWDEIEGDEAVEARIIPYTREGAEKWVAKGHQVILLNRGVFSEPPEAGSDEGEKGTTIFVRIPRSLKDRIAAAAEGESMSVNSWMTRCSERCTGEKTTAINVYCTSWPERKDLPVGLDKNGMGYELTGGPPTEWDRRELVAKILVHPQAPLSDVVVGLRKIANEMVKKEAKFMQRQ